MAYIDVVTQVVSELMDLHDMQDEHKHHKDVWEYSLIVLEQAVAQKTGLDGPVPEPDLVLRLTTLLCDIGKPATWCFEGGKAVTFHQHDMVGTKVAQRRPRELKCDKAAIRDVSRLIVPHQHFHGYGEQSWTDSAVCRYVTNAGPLLQRLHRLTRADYTTRNIHGAKRLSAAYSDLEARIAALRVKGEPGAVRPELDGSEIMEVLGISPGPQIGEAYKCFLAYRMENGLVGREIAETVLRGWWEKCHDGQTTGREGS